MRFGAHAERVAAVKTTGEIPFDQIIQRCVDNETETKKAHEAHGSYVGELPARGLAPESGILSVQWRRWRKPPKLQITESFPALGGEVGWTVLPSD